MAADVFELVAAGHAAQIYRTKTLSQIQRVIRKDFIYFCWSAPVAKIQIFDAPPVIPKWLFNPGRQRMKVSFDLTENQFTAISNLGSSKSIANEEHEATEGIRFLKVHLAAERNQKIVAKFKASLKSFACSICSFDFAKTYGPLGERYIECHHLRPVAEMKPGDKTKISDLAAVCSNCHRMLHHSKPMLETGELRSLLNRK
jgi:hypothetical protein